MPFKYPNPTARIIANSCIDPESECWLWLGSLNNAGRPRITVRRGKKNPSRMLVTRYIALHFLGKNIKSTRRVMAHSCDNPLCVNPDHLEYMTQRHNINDCVARGRHDAMSGVEARKHLTMKGALAWR